MKTAPRTISECDQLLTLTYHRYLAAIDCENISLAAELWIQLHELLDLRIHLPMQRTTVVKQRGRRTDA